MTASCAAPEATAEEYKTSARRFLSQAEVEFAKGDMLQASEKGWGAVAEAVKAAAALRGLAHSGHRQLRFAAMDIAAESGETRIGVLFRTAESLHVNYYEAWMPPQEVRECLDGARELVEILESLPAPNGDSRVRPIRARQFIRDKSDWEE